MTCIVSLIHETPEGKQIKKTEVYVLIKKIVSQEISDMRYVWFNLNSESFDDSHTFKNENEAKRDIFNAFCDEREVFGDKITGISFDYTKGIEVDFSCL